MLSSDTWASGEDSKLQRFRGARTGLLGLGFRARRSSCCGVYGIEIYSEGRGFREVRTGAPTLLTLNIPPSRSLQHPLRAPARAHCGTASESQLWISESPRFKFRASPAGWALIDCPLIRKSTSSRDLGETGEIYHFGFRALGFWGLGQTPKFGILDAFPA